MTAGLLAAAWLLDLLFGDPRWLPHPVVAIGRLIRGAEAFWTRLIPWPLLAGGLLTASVLALVAAASWALLAAAGAVAAWLGIALSLWLGCTCLATRSLHRESARVLAALDAGDLAGARLALSWIVSRDTGELDEEAIIRATCETVAENTSDGIVAPLCFLALGGPVLGMTYKAASTLDSMIGYRNARYLYLGRAAARLDDLLNLIPARLTALLAILCAPLVGLDGRGALAAALRDGGKTSSPNAGYPMAAFAGALGVRFGGPARYFGALVEKPTLGDARQPLTSAAYRRTIRLMYAVSLAALLGAGGCLLLLTGS